MNDAIARAGVCLLSDAPRGVLPHFTTVGDLPIDARVVVVRSPLGQDIFGHLRHRCPHARLVAWLHEGTAFDVGALIDMGFDDAAIGDDDLERHLVAGNGRQASPEAYGRLTSLIDSIIAEPDLHAVLRTSILRMAELFAIKQVSVVLFTPGDDCAFVVAERDMQLDNVIISISQYPELQEVIRTREPLVIADIFGDALLHGVRQKLHDAMVTHCGAVLFPLVRQTEVVGALFLRSPQPMGRLDDKLLVMGRLIAQVTSIAIGNALEQDVLLTERRTLLRQKAYSDQQLASLKHFVDFFEQAKDGIVFTDAFGMIRYANASASTILRRTAEELKHLRFVEVLGERHQRLAQRYISGDAQAVNSGYVDLIVLGSDQEETVISAAIRPLNTQEGVLISFRDVTELREIESELRQTKEFLENLIQSSVDGIVATDIEGGIILFNRAAERVLGYSAREAVGSLYLAQLFPEGEADEIMRRLRSDAYGGKGRLELVHKKIITKEQEIVPVNLTAAIIYEGSTEVASVLIFSDLRELVKIEERLSQMQRQLQISERQTVAAELAGVAAHELNQPLTSIMGYGQLLKRRMPADDPNMRSVDVICRETERMAGIVKRIDQITAYKAKPYVGGSTILDLDNTDDKGQT